MKYRCLVVDHDDTVVNSTATVHFPCFQEFLGIHYPELHYELDEYFIKNFHPGMAALLEDEIGMDAEMLHMEAEYWRAYVKNHVPKAYDGIRELLWAHVKAGGILCVVSHSFVENILRDYRENGLPEPQLVFGWDSPPQERKPNPYPLQKIMEAFGLQPEELLMLDDLKPGYDMASSCGVRFAAAGWANRIPEIENFMRKHCDLYFSTVDELADYLKEP